MTTDSNGNTEDERKAYDKVVSIASRQGHPGAEHDVQRPSRAPVARPWETPQGMVDTAAMPLPSQVMTGQAPPLRHRAPESLPPMSRDVRAVTEAIRLLLVKGSVGIDLTTLTARIYESEMVHLLAMMAMDVTMTPDFRRRCINDVLDRARGKPIQAIQIEKEVVGEPVSADDPMLDEIEQSRMAAAELVTYQRWLRIPRHEWPPEITARYGGAAASLAAEAMNAAAMDALPEGYAVPGAPGAKRYTGARFAPPVPPMHASRLPDATLEGFGEETQPED